MDANSPQRVVVGGAGDTLDGDGAGDGGAGDGGAGDGGPGDGGPGDGGRSRGKKVSAVSCGWRHTIAVVGAAVQVELV